MVSAFLYCYIFFKISTFSLTWALRFWSLWWLLSNMFFEALLTGIVLSCSTWAFHYPLYSTTRWEIWSCRQNVFWYCCNMERRSRGHEWRQGIGKESMGGVIYLLFFGHDVSLSGTCLVLLSWDITGISSFRFLSCFTSLKCWLMRTPLTLAQHS